MGTEKKNYPLRKILRECTCGHQIYSHEYHYSLMLKDGFHGQCLICHCPKFDELILGEIKT